MLITHMVVLMQTKQTEQTEPDHSYKHNTKKPVTTMLTYPWKCTVLHCNHLGNTWKPLARVIIIVLGHQHQWFAGDHLTDALDKSFTLLAFILPSPHLGHLVLQF